MVLATPVATEVAAAHCSGRDPQVFLDGLIPVVMKIVALHRFGRDPHDILDGLVLVVVEVSLPSIQCR
jgi:hypothetical protein